MKPIAIFQHASTEGPGYFATYLDRHRIPWTLVRIDLGEPVPQAVDAYAGLVFMGGPMSVNDPLPWIAPVLALVRDAVAADLPVLGHCLGGQLMAKALGGEVTRNPVKEIGWGEIRVLGTPEATAWFGHAAPAFLSFHWHGETFSIPPGATRLLESAHCANQAFALGPHLGLQCHVEMTPEMIEAWCESGAGEIARNRSRSPAVQTREEMRVDLDARLAALHRVADAVYDRWASALLR
jgi:GMP synthase-like glutamine amidotransferase